MTAMPAEVLTLPRRPLTRADLETMPDDGHRYEVVDGVLIVSPAPSRSHQRAVWRLGRLLDDAIVAADEGLEMLTAPFAVVLADDTEIQPDLVIAPEGRFTESDLPGAPLLAVEVLSPTTRRIDLLLKKDRLRQAGCEHYWVVDPAVPSVLAWRLIDGEYVEVAGAAGEETFTVHAPFPVAFRPVEVQRRSGAAR